MKRELLNTATRLLCVGGMIAVGLIASNQTVLAQSAEQVPKFKYDPEFPKPLPNGWTVGVIGAIHITKADDHIWVAQRPNTVNASTENNALKGIGACCAPAPPVIEWDNAGNLIKAWGLIHQIQKPTGDPSSYTPQGLDVPVGKQVSGPYPDGMWPLSEHAIFVDHKRNVWLTSQNNPSQLVKFTNDGKLIKWFGDGKEATTNADTKNFAGPTDVVVDPQTNEAYIADGYRNRRVIVIDADTGAFKRMWGSFGKPPQDPQQKGAARPDRSEGNLSVTHCVKIANDGLVYVCDRANSRLQVFQKDGKYVTEVFIGIDREMSHGAAWYVAFSPDKEQRFMYVGDGSNKKVWILNRKDLKVLENWGRGGRQGGHFETIHVLDTDSKGNLYVGETLSGNRIQRFNYTGMGPAAGLTYN